MIQFNKSFDQYPERLVQPILRVNLTTSEISQFEIPKDWQQDYLGGASLAARLLYEILTPDLEPFSEKAPLLFLNGPLSGTSGPAVGRFVVCSRSPATRLWAESNCGGFWGVELRMAGFDGLWVEGRSPDPVYIWIQDNQVQIHPARHLWGLDTYQTQIAISEELNSGKIRVATIGPAGEAYIPFALIHCDHGRLAGRTGMGAVMGWKNLKAIAVQGHQKVPVVDPSSFSPLRAEANRSLREDSQTMVLRELGTSGAAEYFDYLNEMPKRYYQHGAFDQEIQVSGAAMKDTILVGVSACHACVIACGRVVNLGDGKKRKGPEYETLVGFGPNLGLNDAVLVTQLGELCDRYGVDSISMSNTIGLAFRLYEMGLLTGQDANGLELAWGNADCIKPLIEMTVRRQGIGAVMAKGALALGEHYGVPEEAVQVNNLEVAYHDPRGASGMALTYATSPRGACHNQSDYFFVDIGQADETLGLQTHSRHAGAEKAANVARHQDFRTLTNALVMCVFSSLDAQLLVDLINVACGLNWTIEDMLLCGERGWNLKRAINNRLGLTRSNDRLPKALLEPYIDVDIHGILDELGFKQMLEAYYQVRGWDLITGYPSREKLHQLNLGFVLKDLY
jgi:aldehyde:ferredoxin oxidoreductase